MLRARTRVLAGVAATALLVGTLSACGGGGVRGSDRRRVLALSERNLDGWVRSDGELETRGEGPGVGDLDTGQEVRLFYSFPLRDVPAGITVERATLSFFQAFSVGSPFALNPLLVESVDIGSTLDASDFSSDARGTPASIQLNSLRIRRQLDVTTLVQRDLDEGRSRSQFRLRFLSGTDGDTISDFVGFETADNDHRTGEVPELEILIDRGR